MFVDLTAALALAEAADKAAEGATEGPWMWVERHPTNAVAEVYEETSHGFPLGIATLYGGQDHVPRPSFGGEPWGHHPIRQSNARFIAASRQLVPDMAATIRDLCTEVQRLQARVTSLSEQVDTIAALQARVAAIMGDEG